MTAALASALVDAFRSGAVVHPIAGELPLDMPSAERLQDAVVAQLGTVGAWKLGATVPDVRKKLGLPHTFFGAIPSERVCMSPAHIPADHLRHFGVETEVAFRLGIDLPVGPKPVTRETVRSAVSSVHASLEIPATRFDELGGFGGYALVGDNGATGWLVVGAPVEEWNEADLLAVAVSLDVDGIALAHGTPAVVEGGPFGALVEHVHRAHRRGYALRAGQYIATGSCTGYLTVPFDKVVRGCFGPLGSVTLVFEQAGSLS